MIRNLLGALKTLAGVTLGVLLVAVPGTAFLARFGDGPVGPFPGGPLHGELARKLPEDWRFLDSVYSIEIEVRSERPRTVRIGILQHRGQLFAPVVLAPLKLWPRDARRDRRVRVRIERRIYEMDVAWITDPAWLEALRASGRIKYGALWYGGGSAGMTGFFRLEPVDPS